MYKLIQTRALQPGDREWPWMPRYIAKAIWKSHRLAAHPISTYGSLITRGVRRVVAAKRMGIEEIEVAVHDGIMVTYTPSGELPLHPEIWAAYGSMNYQEATRLWEKDSFPIMLRGRFVAEGRKVIAAKILGIKSYPVVHLSPIMLDGEPDDR